MSKLAVLVMLVQTPALRRWQIGEALDFYVRASHSQHQTLLAKSLAGSILIMLPPWEPRQSDVDASAPGPRGVGVHSHPQKTKQQMYCRCVTTVSKTSAQRWFIWQAVPSNRTPN